MTTVRVGGLAAGPGDAAPWCAGVVTMQESVGDARFIREIAGIAAAPGAAADRAQALLEPLYRLLRFDAAWISLVDPEIRGQQVVVRQGYPDRVKRYLDSAALIDDLERGGMHRTRPPMRFVDLPLPPDELPVWAEYLYPAGFREAVGVTLTTADGRYLGVLSANTESAIPASDASCLLLQQVTPMLAHALDPLRAVGAVASMVTDAVAGVVLTRAGSIVSLPGLPDDGLLAAGSPVLAAAAGRLADGQLHTVFLCPGDAADVQTDLLRVTALACPLQPAGHLSAVVLLSPPPDLHGLTRRELEVLGLLLEGWTNSQMAAALTVAKRTVIVHLEHIMSKLQATTRTMAAMRARGRGLFVPAELVTGPQRAALEE